MNNSSLLEKLIWASQQYETMVTELVAARADDDQPDREEKAIDVLTTHVAEVRAIIANHTHHLRVDREGPA